MDQFRLLDVNRFFPELFKIIFNFGAKCWRSDGAYYGKLNINLSWPNESNSSIMNIKIADNELVFGYNELVLGYNETVLNYNESVGL